MAARAPDEGPKRLARTQSAFRRLQQARWVLIFVVVVSGLALSALLYWMLWTRQRELAETQFELDFQPRGWNFNFGVIWSPSDSVNLGGVFKTPFRADVSLSKRRADIWANPTGLDDVTVNAPDPALRENRLKLLSEIRAATYAVADFSKIAG